MGDLFVPIYGVMVSDSSALVAFVDFKHVLTLRSHENDLSDEYDRLT